MTLSRDFSPFAVILRTAANLGTQHMWSGPYVEPPTSLAARTLAPGIVQIFARADDASIQEFERKLRERLPPALHVQVVPWRALPVSMGHWFDDEPR